MSNTATSNAKKVRVDYIDLAKGLAIFMVVWGHTVTNDVLTSANPPMLIKILYSIHMPLFFFLSGMCVSRKTVHQQNGWRYFIHKTFLTTGVPYLVWALIYSAFSYSIVPWILYGSWEALNYKAMTLSSLWFLSCLCLSKIAVEGVKLFITEQTKWKLDPACAIIACILIVVGYLIPKLPMGYPWCADIAFVATGCMLLGFSSRKLFDKIRKQPLWRSILAFVVLVGLYAVCVFLRKDGQFTLMLMANGTYGEPLWALLCAVFGGSAVIILSMIYTKFANAHMPDFTKKPLIYIGQHTIGILLIHKPLMQQVIIPLLTKLYGESMSTGAIAFFSAVLALIISLIASLGIEHYIPELVGIFSQEILDEVLPEDEEENT